MGDPASLEGLVMGPFYDAYRGRRVLITGHTGFKGSWLALWLQQLGAQVTGIGLDPATSPSHWDLVGLDLPEQRVDIRDSEKLRRAVRESRPEVVFHLAAQALVRRSYRDPLETWSTNVMGTASLLEACRHTDSVRAVVVVTTDKVYDNREWHWGYRETDRLGGSDCYSASKAAAELVAENYRKAFFSAAGAPLLATARSGNVIGGGDWSEDRLLPDMFRSVSQGVSLPIRSPGATRPWQHVLECLNGYLMLGEFLLQGRRECADAWNFGPDPDGNLTVLEMLTAMKRSWPELSWHVTAAPPEGEARLLHLDNSKAKSLLGWRPVWSVEEAVARTASWYRSYGADGSVNSLAQLRDFVADAASARSGSAA